MYICLSMFTHCCFRASTIVLLVLVQQRAVYIYYLNSPLYSIQPLVTQTHKLYLCVCVYF